MPTYQIFRNEDIIAGPATDLKYNTYVAPLYNDGQYSKGYIAIQFESNYMPLLPRLIFQPPTPASYISVWNQGGLIFSNSSALFSDWTSE